MDINSTFRAIARYWWLTVPILVLTLLGMGYVVFLQPKTYEATSTYVLLNPEPSQTSNANPFVQLPDQSAVVGVISEIVNSPSVNRELVAQGANEDYTVGPSEVYGQGSRIVAVTAPGATPEEALKTSELVGAKIEEVLDTIQSDRDVPKNARITLLTLNPEPEARLKISSLLRSVIAVALLGMVLLFTVIAGAQALEESRSGRRKVEGPTPEAEPEKIP